MVCTQSNLEIVLFKWCIYVRSKMYNLKDCARTQWNRLDPYIGCSSSSIVHWTAFIHSPWGARLDFPAISFIFQHSRRAAYFKPQRNIPDKSYHLKFVLAKNLFVHKSLYTWIVPIATSCTNYSEIFWGDDVCIFRIILWISCGFNFIVWGHILLHSIMGNASNQHFESFSWCITS